MVIIKEHIIKLFELHDIEHQIEYDEHNFWRIVKFRLFDDDFYHRIVWYKNVLTLQRELYDIEIKFHNMTINRNYPNLYKNNINFLFNNETICVLPIEKY